MSKKLPQVSIVVPAYNAEGTLEETIQSVLDQTLSDFEVIAIDDGSADATGEILKKFAKGDKRVRVFSTVNQGLSAARNFGIDKATGRWILFLDADDVIVAHCLETLVKEGTSANADIVLFDTVPFPDSKFAVDRKALKRVAEFTRYYDRKAEYFVASGPDMLVSLVKKKSYLPSACLYLANNDLLQSTGLRFHEAIIMEDNLFTPHLLASAGKVVYTKQGLHRRRLSSDSLTSSRGLNHAISLLFIADRLEHRFLGTTDPAGIASAVFGIARALRASALRDFSQFLSQTVAWLPLRKFFQMTLGNQSKLGKLTWGLAVQRPSGRSLTKSTVSSFRGRGEGEA